MVAHAVLVMVEVAVALATGRSPAGDVSVKLDTMIRDGLFSGRQMCSPLPVQIARPSESWISGRQSTAVGFAVSEYQNIEVSGAMPSRSIGLRRNSAASMSMTTPLVAADREAVGASEARPVEQGVDDHRVVLGGGRLEPEVREVGEFLRAGRAWRQRDAARRQADLAKFANGAEIGGAEEGRPRLELLPARVACGLVNPEAGKGGGLGRQASWRHGPVRP